MPIDIKIPAEGPIHTASRVNELIDAGYRFTALVEGRREVIRAVGAEGEADSIAIVIGQIHENRWAVTDACTIRWEGAQRVSV